MTKKNKFQINEQQPQLFNMNEELTKLTSVQLGLPDDFKLPNIPLPAPTALSQPLEFTTLSSELVVFNRARAVEYLQLPTFEGERNIKPYDVREILMEIRAGRFNFSATQIVAAVFDGVLYKINGQHTCLAIAYMPEPYQATIRYTVHCVKDKDNMTRLYSTYDRGSRTKSHVFQVELINKDYAHGFSRKTLGLLRSGFSFWHYTTEQHQHNNVGQTVGLIDSNYQELFRRVGEFVQTIPRKLSKIRRMAVVAAMFGSFEADPASASHFWQAVVDVLHMTSQNDARYKLRELLDQYTTATYRVGVNANTQRKIVSDEHIYRICQAAWNKWCNNEQVLTLRVSMTRLPYQRKREVT
jgi:hypothetical protein